jgi:hypothetical protein
VLDSWDLVGPGAYFFTLLCLYCSADITAAEYVGAVRPCWLQERH